MQRMRTLAVLATIAIVAVATPPPATESPPTFTVSPLTRAVGAPAVNTAADLNLVLARAPSGDATMLELDAGKTQDHPTLAALNAAEPSRSLTANARGRPRGNYFLTNNLAAKLYNARIANTYVTRSASIGIRLRI